MSSSHEMSRQGPLGNKDFKSPPKESSSGWSGIGVKIRLFEVSNSKARTRSRLFLDYQSTGKVMVFKSRAGFTSAVCPTPAAALELAVLLPNVKSVQKYKADFGGWAGSSGDSRPERRGTAAYDDGCWLIFRLQSESGACRRQACAGEMRIQFVCQPFHQRSVIRWHP